MVNNQFDINLSDHENDVNYDKSNRYNNCDLYNCNNNYLGCNYCGDNHVKFWG